jgi:hypothetical protein
MRLLCLVLLLASTTAVAEGGSTLKVRCPENCTVRIEGRTGRRISDSHWEFRDVAPGRRRIEAKGLLGRNLVSSYVDIPSAPEALVYIDSRGRLGVSQPPAEATPASAPPAPAPQEAEATPASAPPAPAPQEDKAPASVLHVRCQKPCSVFVDNVRRASSGSTHTFIVHGVTPGSHTVEARFLLGSSVRLGSIDVPPGSEVFVYATDEGVKVTNTRPLDK